MRYAAQLRRVANQIGHLVAGFPADDPALVPTITQMLAKYAEALEPWAVQAATQMLVDVNHRDEQAWSEMAKDMSVELRREIQRAPTGKVFQELLAEQVTLIKSLPIEAAQRVHDLTIKGLEDSTRASEIAKEIMRTGEVTASRATLIARTEVARTASALTQARAQHIGVTSYVWRTSGDSDVRPGHKAMNGKVFEFANPPAVNENGKILHHHPGAIWNCRCWPDPVLPEE